MAGSHGPPPDTALGGQVGAPRVPLRLQNWPSVLLQLHKGQPCPSVDFPRDHLVPSELQSPTELVILYIRTFLSG